MLSFRTNVEVEIDSWDLCKYIASLSSDDLAELGVMNRKELENMRDTFLELKKLVDFKPYSHEAILFEKLERELER